MGVFEDQDGHQGLVIHKDRLQKQFALDNMKDQQHYPFIFCCSLPMKLLKLEFPPLDHPGISSLDATLSGNCCLHEDEKQMLLNFNQY